MLGFYGVADCEEGSSGACEDWMWDMCPDECESAELGDCEGISLNWIYCEWALCTTIWTIHCEFGDLYDQYCYDPELDCPWK